MKNRVRIALVDDHALFREGLKDLLAGEPDFEIVAEGGDGAEALTIVSEMKPDVLLIDLRLPKLGGLSAIRRLRETYREMKIVVVSMYEDDEFKREAFSSGADAYHSKMDAASSVIKTIRRLVSGKKGNAPVFSHTLQGRRGARLTFDDSPVSLTATELAVLESLSRGSNNRDLARNHCISERTLKNHLNSIFRKLGVKSRLEAVHSGYEKKLISPAL